MGYRRKKVRVYVCFADLDRSAVESVLDRTANVEFIDPAGLSDQANVVLAIRRSHAVVLFSSAHSQQADQVARELAIAQQFQVPIINYSLAAGDGEILPGMITVEGESDTAKTHALEQSLSQLLADKRKKYLVLGVVAAATLLLVSSGSMHLARGGSIGRKTVQSTIVLNKSTRPLLPGELAQLDIPPAPEIPLDEQCLWIGFSSANASLPAIPIEPDRTSLLAMLAHNAAIKLGLPLEVSLGWGTDSLSPHPLCLEKITVGFAIPPGIKYPIESISDERDVEGNWFGTAQRLKDGALVSVIPTAHGWYLVDQEALSVERYLKFLGSAEAMGFLEASAKVAGQVPKNIRSLRGRALDPLRGLEPTGNTEAGWAKSVGVGPRFHDPSPDKSLQGYVAYPSSAWPEDHFDIELSKLPGSSTACLPVVGISYAEADAYRRWINEAGSSWTFPDEGCQFLQTPSTVASKTSLSIAPTSDTRGKAKFGLIWFGSDNVLEYQRAVHAASVTARGSAHFSGRTGEIKLDCYDRPADVSFRFVQVVKGH